MNVSTSGWAGNCISIVHLLQSHISFWRIYKLTHRTQTKSQAWECIVIFLHHEIIIYYTRKYHFNGGRSCHQIDWLNDLHIKVHILLRFPHLHACFLLVILYFCESCVCESEKERFPCLACFSLKCSLVVAEIFLLSAAVVLLRIK